MSGEQFASTPASTDRSAHLVCGGDIFKLFNWPGSFLDIFSSNQCCRRRGVVLCEDKLQGLQLTVIVRCCETGFKVRNTPRLACPPSEKVVSNDPKPATSSGEIACCLTTPKKWGVVTARFRRHRLKFNSCVTALKL